MPTTRAGLPVRAALLPPRQLVLGPALRRPERRLHGRGPAPRRGPGRQARSVDVITRTAHYGSVTVSGAGYDGRGRSAGSVGAVVDLWRAAAGQVRRTPSCL
jgi:hypothetical protein